MQTLMGVVGVLRQLSLETMLLKFFGPSKEASAQLKLSRASQGWLTSLGMVSRLFISCLQSQ